ncbi:MAG: amidase, partial [Caldilineaceae bacterium]
MFTNPAPLAATVDELRTGQHSLSLYIEQQCLRIDRVEPHVAALLPEPERKARLLADGRALTAAYPRPDERPPLFGCLLGVKDIIHADGFPTQAGSTIPAENFVGPEAAAVTLLKQAGALVVGKTVTTEFAYFEPGPTRNPHDILHTPGGSSSGSAAAVAAGMCYAAVGTDTGGSIRIPAAYCGVAGLKPTYGRVSLDGIFPLSWSLDHAGPIARTSADAALLLDVLTGRRAASIAPLPLRGRRLVVLTDHR